MGVAGHRHRHRLAGRARHHHHLPGRAAGHPRPTSTRPRSLDGAGALAAVPQSDPPAAVGLPVHQHHPRASRASSAPTRSSSALTGGGPGTSTISVAMKIFSGFTGGDYAYQMANAVIYFLITLIISLCSCASSNAEGLLSDGHHHHLRDTDPRPAEPAAGDRAAAPAGTRGLPGQLVAHRADAGGVPDSPDAAVLLRRDGAQDARTDRQRLRVRTAEPGAVEQLLRRLHPDATSRWRSS